MRFRRLLTSEEPPLFGVRNDGTARCALILGHGEVTFLGDGQRGEKNSQKKARVTLKKMCVIFGALEYPMYIYIYIMKLKDVDFFKIDPVNETSCFAT